jgi:hypothetical protein
MRFCLRMFAIRSISGRAARRKEASSLPTRKNPRIDSLEKWKDYSLRKGKLFPAAGNSRRLDGDQIVPLLGI